MHHLVKRAYRMRRQVRFAGCLTDHKRVVVVVAVDCNCDESASPHCVIQKFTRKA